MQAAVRNIFEYADHRVFLKDVVSARKARASGGLRTLAISAGFRSPSTLSMVIRGQRALSADAAERLAGAIGLDGRHKAYFCLLAKTDRARTDSEKSETHEAMVHLRATREQGYLGLSQYRFLSLWFYPTIYVMVSLKNFRRDPSWIAKRLGRGITVRQVKTALGDLRNLELLREQDGKLVQASGPLSTCEAIRHAAIRRYHEQMIDLSRAALDLPLDQREMDGLTIDIAKKRMPELAEKIRNFRKEINEHFARYQDADEVYQLNIQLFPLTSGGEENEP